MKTNELQQLVLELDKNKLIFADDLYLHVYAKHKIERKIFNVYLARITKQGYLERLQRGVYFRVNETKFGKTRPNLFKETIKIYTEGNKGFYGYETLLNSFGIRNEMSRKLTIYTTNPFRTTLTDKNIIIKRINLKLDKENIKYFQIIYLLRDLDKHNIENDEIYPKIAQYMKENKMQFDRFFDYLGNFDNSKLLHHFIPLKIELRNETA